MFRLLSKESNIFSVPVYIGFLLLIVIAFNILNFNVIDSVSTIVTFSGVALGYFVFNQIGLTYQTHLPLFLYTFFIFSFYPGDLDIGIAVSLLTNSFLLLILTTPDDAVRQKNHLLAGAILAVNFIFLPTVWPLFLFVLLHIVATSKNILLNIFRLVFGMVLIFFAYFCVMYFFRFTTFNPEYLPVPSSKFISGFYPLYFLLPVLVFALYAVCDHFLHYNEKSPVSRYKYTFILTFTLAQLITIVLYMGSHYEYLLLLAFPASIILSRALIFLPKYWMRETALWIQIFSLILFKVGGYLNLF